LTKTFPTGSFRKITSVSMFEYSISHGLRIYIQGTFLLHLLIYEISICPKTVVNRSLVGSPLDLHRTVPETCDPQQEFWCQRASDGSCRSQLLTLICKRHSHPLHAVAILRIAYINCQLSEFFFSHPPIPDFLTFVLFSHFRAVYA
jgi:hypothetical protein